MQFKVLFHKIILSLRPKLILMVEYYIIFSIFVTSGLFLACGLMFFFVAVPENPLLGNYRKARYTIAVTYLFFIPMNLLEYLFSASNGQNIPLFSTVSLAISISQAFLFTYALLALLDVRFPGWSYFFRQAILVLLFITVVFTVYVFCPENYFSVVFFVLTGVYALLLGYYTIIFVTNYRRFRLRMDNYFSDFEVVRLHWVNFSFFAALSIGVMALLSIVFMSTFIALLFTIVFNLFYIWFAIRFINYPFRFRTIEAAMTDDIVEESTSTEIEKPITNNNVETLNSPVFIALDERIDQWIAGKGFIEKGITIDILASKLFTNRNYLSACINTGRKQTFREWINELRIEEAKTLTRQHPAMTINEIAFQVGYTDKSHLIRQFTKQTGASFKKWKQLKS